MTLDEYQQKIAKKAETLNPSIWVWEVALMDAAKDVSADGELMREPSEPAARARPSHGPLQENPGSGAAQPDGGGPQTGTHPRPARRNHPQGRCR